MWLQRLGASITTLVSNNHPSKCLPRPKIVFCITDRPSHAGLYGARYITAPTGTAQYMQGVSHPVYYAATATAAYPTHPPPSYDYYASNTVPPKVAENTSPPSSRMNKRPPQKRSKTLGGIFPSRSGPSNSVPNVKPATVVQSPVPQYPVHYQPAYTYPYYYYPGTTPTQLQQTQQAEAARQQQTGSTSVSQQQHQQPTPATTRKADQIQRRSPTPAPPIVPDPGTPDTFIAQPPPVVTLKILPTDTEDEHDELSRSTPHPPLKPPEIIITNESGDSKKATLVSPVEPHNIALPNSPPDNSLSTRSPSPRSAAVVIPSISGTMAAMSPGAPSKPPEDHDRHFVRNDPKPPLESLQGPSLTGAPKSPPKPIIPSDSGIGTVNAAVKAAREAPQDLPMWMHQDGSKGTTPPGRTHQGATRASRTNDIPFMHEHPSREEMGAPRGHKVVGKSRTLPYAAAPGSVLFQPPVSTTPTPPDEEHPIPGPSTATTSSSTRRIGPFPFGIPKFVGRFGFGRKAPPSAPIIPIIPEASGESPTAPTHTYSQGDARVKGKGKRRDTIPMSEEDDRPPSLTPSEVTSSTVTIPTPTSTGPVQFQQQQGIGHQQYQQNSQKSKSTPNIPIVPENTSPSSPSTPTAAPRRKRPHRKSMSGAGPPPPPPMRIHFGAFCEPYFGFSIASPHKILYNKRLYPTAEHLFNAFKFLPAKAGRRAGNGNGFMGVGGNEAVRIAEAVRNAGTRGIDAWLAAKRYEAWIRPDWEEIQVDKVRTSTVSQSILILV